MGTPAVILFARRSGDPHMVGMYVHHGAHIARLAKQAVEHARPRWGDSGYDTRMAIAYVIMKLSHGTGMYGPLGQLGSGIFSCTLEEGVEWHTDNNWIIQICWDERKILIQHSREGCVGEYTFEEWFNLVGENTLDYDVYHSYDTECECDKCSQTLKEDNQF